MKKLQFSGAMDKVGAVGALLAAAAAPCCFPMLAWAGAALGLGALESLRGYMDYAIQGFAALSALGGAMAWRQHRQAWPLGVGLAGAAMVFFSYYVAHHVALIYAGMSGLAIAAIGNAIARRRSSGPVQLQSTLTCPHCGHRQQETMPTGACLFFYECRNCRAMLRPKPGDCCVFCSYGSVKCPPIQAEYRCRSTRLVLTEGNARPSAKTMTRCANKDAN